MARELKIEDHVGDNAINETVRQHAPNLLAAGVERLVISPNPHSEDNHISLDAKKLHGYWTGATAPANEAMRALREDLERKDIPSKIIEFKQPIPAEVHVQRRPFLGM